MACVLNMYVLSLALLATLTGGSMQFDILDKKINAVRDMMGVEIDIIKQDFAILVKNLSMSVIGEIKGKNGNVNTPQIANTLCENPLKNTQAAEDFYKEILCGFSSEKMSLRKNILEIFKHLNATVMDVSRIDGAIKSHGNDFSKIEQSVKNVQDKQERFKGELDSLETNFIKFKKDVGNATRPVETTVLAELQRLNAHVDRNKNDIEELKRTVSSGIKSFEAKLNEAKEGAIKKSNEIVKLLISFASCYEFKKFGNSVYFEMDGKMNFDEGSRRCKEFGAHLADVTTSEENAFLTNTFGQIFLGGTDSQREGQWVWFNNGQAITLKNWDSATGEPNNLHGGENCLQLRTSGKWNNLRCTINEKIVCELKSEYLNVYLKIQLKRYLKKKEGKCNFVLD